LLAAVVFGTALAASLAFIRSYPLPPPANDAVEYFRIAQNLAAGKGFSADGAHPYAYRPPLFSVLLGIWFRATGASSVPSAAVFQSLLHAFGAAAAFGLFLEILPSLAWAFGAALFLAVNPLLVTRAAFILQEPTVLLFTVLAAWATVGLVKAPSTARAALSGAAWGVCTLGKVVSWYVPLLILAMRFLPGRLRFALRGKEAAALLLCFAAVFAPWTARNYFHFHRFIPVNDQGEGMLAWNVSHASIPGEAAGSQVVAELRERNLPEEERKALLWTYVKRHLRYFLVDRTLRNAIDFASPARDWWWERGRYGPGEPRPWYWTDVFLRGLYLLLLYRTWQWGRGRAIPAFGFVVLLYWTYWIEHALVLGAPRFGLAVYPLLVAMAAPVVLGDRRNGEPVSEARTPAPA
jgi:hypothetical protein